MSQLLDRVAVDRVNVTDVYRIAIRAVAGDPLYAVIRATTAIRVARAASDASNAMTRIAINDVVYEREQP